jgi:hypothetical protein
VTLQRKSFVPQREEMETEGEADEIEDIEENVMQKLEN